MVFRERVRAWSQAMDGSCNAAVEVPPRAPQTVRKIPLYIFWKMYICCCIDDKRALKHAPCHSLFFFLMRFMIVVCVSMVINSAFNSLITSGRALISFVLLIFLRIHEFYFIKAFTKSLARIMRKAL